MTSSDQTNNPQGEHTLDSTLSKHHIREMLERSLRAAKDGKVISQEEMERRYLGDTRRELLL